MRIIFNLWRLAAVATVLVLPCDNKEAAWAVGSAPPIEFYVAVDGNDAWSGKLPAADATGTDGPFATLACARDAIRRLKADSGLQQPVTIFIRKGTYYLAEPLLLTGDDSGTRQCPITYKAYRNEKPVLSGGKIVAGWKPYKGRIMQCSLAGTKVDKLKFRQLFFDGRRQTRARWPNLDPKDPRYSGWAFIGKKLPKQDKKPAGFSFSADTPPRDWAKPHQAEVNVFPWVCWVNDLIPLEQIDQAKQTMALTRNSRFAWMPVEAGNRFFVENVLEELDRPGEWCLDTETATLYFWLPKDTAKDITVTVPRIDTLIVLRGTAESPVRNVTISGLTFTETLSTFPEHLHSNFHAPLLHGAAVRLEHCENCGIENSYFHNLGGDGVRLQGANSRNRIVGNEIAHIGGAAVSLAGKTDFNTNAWNNAAVLREHSARYPKLIRNLISNNHIHHCGVLKKSGGAVHLNGINSVENVVSHNLIHDTPDKGVNMQDGFGRVIIEYNEMYNLGYEISDTGGIMVNRWYPLEGDPELARGHLIRFNIIRNLIGCGAYLRPYKQKGEGAGLKAGGKIHSPYYTWGIYFDNSGMDNIIYGNIIVSTVLGAVSMPVGEPQNNLVENNIFINSSGNQFDLRMGAEARGNRVLRNIVYYTDPKAMLLAARPSAKQSLAQCDYNLYWPAAGQKLRIRGIGDGSFAAWMKLGFEKHSMIAAPLFVDVKGGDYRLRANSPAFKLGFKPIDVQKIGLQENTSTASPGSDQDPR